MVGDDGRRRPVRWDSRHSELGCMQRQNDKVPQGCAVAAVGKSTSHAVGRTMTGTARRMFSYSNARDARGIREEV